MRGGYFHARTRPEDWFASAPASTTTVTPRVFDISDLLSVLRRSRRLIAISIATTTALGLMAGVLTPRTYQASTQLYIDARGVKVLANDLSQQSAVDAALAEFESQIKILSSGSVMLRVAERERLGTDPTYIPQPGLMTRLRAILPGGSMPTVQDRNQLAAAVLERRIAIRRADRSFVVEVIASDSDAQRAARIAQAVAEVYLESRVTNRRDLARRLGGEVSERLQDLRERVEAAENRLNDFKTANNLVYSSGGLVAEQDLTELNNQLNTARARTVRAKARLDQVNRLNGAAVATAEVLDSATIVQLRIRLAEANRQSAELRKNLGPLHPDIRAAEERIREANAGIAAEVERRRTAIRGDYEQALAAERALAKQIADLKSKSNDIGQSLIALRELERAVEANKKVYEEFLLRSRELAEQQGLSTSASYIVTSAVAPAQHSGLPFLAFVGIGFFSGIPVGVGLALLRHAARGREDDPPLDVTESSPPPHDSQRRGIRLDISTPALNAYISGGCLTRVSVPPDEVSDLADAIASRANLDQKAVVLVVGGGSRGSADVAAALAACWCYDGYEVLAVDGDSGRAELSQLAGGLAHPGLFDRLHRNVESFVRWQRKGLPHLLTSLDPSLRRDLPGSRRIVAQRLVDLAEAVDTLVIDAGDISANEFAVPLARIATACVLVAPGSDAMAATATLKRLGLAVTAHVALTQAPGPQALKSEDGGPVAAKRGLLMSLLARPRGGASPAGRKKGA